MKPLTRRSVTVGLGAAVAAIPERLTSAVEGGMARRAAAKRFVAESTVIHTKRPVGRF
jgi:hypothetical protein